MLPPEVYITDKKYFKIGQSCCKQLQIRNKIDVDEAKKLEERADSILAELSIHENNPIFPHQSLALEGSFNFL